MQVVNVEMNARSGKGIINKGGTILKTARSDDFRTDKGRKNAFEMLSKKNIDGLIVLGGVKGVCVGGADLLRCMNNPRKRWQGVGLARGEEAADRRSNRAAKQRKVGQ